MSSRTRLKAKGRLGAERGERFARLPQSLLESEAVATLPASAFKLLALLTLGARPPGLDPRKDKGSNGVQAITDSYARKFGMSSRDTVYRGLNTLIERGLIIRTREGWKSKTHFALYAVAWLPITHRDGQPLDTPERADDSWRTWTQTTPKAKKKTPGRSRPMIGHDGPTSTENLPSDSRTQSRPMIGRDEAICRPMVSTSSEICRPMIGNTLRTLGMPGGVPHGDGDGNNGSHAPVARPESESESRSQKFARKLPTTAMKKVEEARRLYPSASDSELAKKARVTTGAVKAARALWMN